MLNPFQKVVSQMMEEKSTEQVTIFFVSQTNKLISHNFCLQTVNKKEVYKHRQRTPKSKSS